MVKHAMSVFALLALTGVASAGTLTLSGGGGVVPLGGMGGTAGEDGNFFRSTVSVFADAPITDITVRLLDFEHSWAGDLIITLENMTTGTSVELVHRVGRIDSGFGDSSDFHGDYAFNDSYTGDLWTAASTVSMMQAIAPGEYAPSSQGDATSSLGDFIGQSTLGDWMLSIEDRAGADSGMIGSWEVMFGTVGQVVPMPMTAGLGLAGLGTVCLTATRRRRV